MDKAEIARKDEMARKILEKARTDLQKNPLEAFFIQEIRKEVHLGMKFEVTTLDFENRKITFTIVK